LFPHLPGTAEPAYPGAVASRLELDLHIPVQCCFHFSFEE
jgi:hypothetical protein